MKWLWIALGLLGLGIVAALIVPRVVSDDPARWHVDPSTVEPSPRPNDYRVTGYDAVRFSVPAGEVAEALDALILAMPRTRHIAGTDLWRSYVQRSAVFGFPDYLSFRVLERGDGAVLGLYSRSRFGYSDWGVNKARVEGLLGALTRRLDES